MAPHVRVFSPFKRLLCLVLSATISLLGLPSLSSAQTPQLLREPEQLMSAADCAALLRHVNYLSDPKTKETLEKAYYAVQRLEAQLAGDVRATDEAFKKEMWNEAKEEVQDLVVKGYLKAIQSRAVELRQAGELHANSPSSLIWFRDTFVPFHVRLLEKIDELEKRVKYLTTLSGEYNDRKYAQGLRDASRAARDSLEAQRVLEEKLRVYDEARREQLAKAREDALKMLGKKLAALGGPLGEAAFKVALLDISLALYLSDTKELSLARTRESALTMRDQLQKLELNRNMYQHQYQRDCRPATRVAEQVQPPATPPPQPTPPANAPSSSGISSGVAIGSGLLIGGLIAGAAALGAAAGGGGGGSSGSSSICLKWNCNGVGGCITNYGANSGSIPYSSLGACQAAKPNDIISRCEAC